MVSFAGYEMPVQYPGGIIQEHRHTRTDACLFDISHMGQVLCTGHEASAGLERVTPSDLATLAPRRQIYSVLTNEAGGIIDDVMITRTETGFYLVINAACRDKDIRYLRAMLGNSCKLELMDDHALIALQGPAAAAVLTRYHRDIGALLFLQSGEFIINGIPCVINRSGYTGEDGFEISVASDKAESLARELLAGNNILPAGLGARDSLRLEAGLCLYGHDIDEETTPVEAGLGWVIAKKYRGGNIVAAEFPGAEKILGQLKNGTDKIRTGFRPESKIPVREGTEIVCNSGATVGIVTSGGFGPTAGGPVAMGYIRTEYADPATSLSVEVRGRSLNLSMVTLPFVPHRYNKRQRSSCNERA